MRCVPGTGDELYLATPEAGGWHLPQVVEAYQLLAFAVEYRAAADEATARSRARRQTCLGDAGGHGGTGSAVSGEDVGDEVVEWQRRARCGEDRGEGPRIMLADWAVKPMPMAGLGRRAASICAADATGGVPKMTKPAVSGMAGVASSAMCPPRLQAITTASRAATASANPARMAAYPGSV